MQIGSNVTIETVGFDNINTTFSEVKIPFSEQYIQSVKKIEDLEIDTEEALLKGKNHNTYYKVTINEYL